MMIRLDDTHSHNERGAATVTTLRYTIWARPGYQASTGDCRAGLCYKSGYTNGIGS